MLLMSATNEIIAIYIYFLYNLGSKEVSRNKRLCNFKTTT